MNGTERARPDHASLVRQAALGDRSAFARLVETEWNRLVRLARSVVGDADAEDAVQDALIHAWKKLPGLDRPDAFPTWIARIVARGCFRRNRRRPSLAALAESPEPRVQPAVEASLDVERLLSLLAPRQRAVMHLTVIEGLSDREIGTLLGITAGSVRAHRRRARETLNRALGHRPRASTPAEHTGQAEHTTRATPGDPDVREEPTP